MAHLPKRLSTHVLDGFRTLRDKFSDLKMKRDKERGELETERRTRRMEGGREERCGFGVEEVTKGRRREERYSKRLE